MSDDIEVASEDVGLQFLIQIDDENNPGSVIDLSSYGGFKIYFKKPDKTVITMDGILYSDGTDGLIYCISTPGLLDIPGRWKLQVSYTRNNGIIYTTKDSFVVFEDLDENDE